MSSPPVDGGPGAGPGHPAPADVRLRPLRWWDLEDVLVAERELFGASAWSAESFWGELAQPNRHYLVAVRGQELLGYGGVMVAGADADVQTLAVARTAQRRGIGALLLAELSRVAAGRGATALLLEVRADNDAALRLYGRAGFEPIARRARYYPDGGDAVIMRRRLPQP